MNVFRSRAFDFVDEVQKLPDAAGVLGAMDRALRQRGFEYFCCAFAAPTPTEPAREAVLAERLPAGFLDMYSEKQFVHIDPALRYCAMTVRPFRWLREAPYDPEREPRAAELVQRARDFGMVDGFMIPVATPAHRMGLLYFGGGEIEMAGRELPALHLMALYAFDRVLKLRGLPETPQLALSLREREVLTHAALGRSTEEIAEALSITARTVKAHVKSCCRKLGAVTRTQAVMIAMRGRIISP